MVLTGCKAGVDACVMFERFTDRARRAVVLAQEEARALEHNYIGTEHILLGLLRESDGVAARVLGIFGLTLPEAREEVLKSVGRGKKPIVGHIPFTPRSKKVLEFALREALAMGHNYIGTEHILLGVMREGEGPGGRIVAARVPDLSKIRMAVLDMIPATPSAGGPRWLRQPATGPGGGPIEPVLTTPAADSSLHAATRLAGTRPVGSHHLMQAALSDANSAAARALTSLGVDLDRALDALRSVDVTGTNDEPPEEAGRRNIIIRTSQDRLSIEATDTTLLELARAAIEALGLHEDEAGIIRGDLPASVSLGNVWKAVRDSLEDIRRRATAESPGAAVPSSAAATEPSGSAEPGDQPEPPESAQPPQGLDEQGG